MRVLVSLCIAFALWNSACRSHSDNKLEGAENLSQLNLGSSAWIDKAARVLRGGHGLTNADAVDALLAMPRHEIVDRFMSSSEFLDSVVAFGQYFFLKTPLVNLVNARTALRYAAFPQILHAAIEVNKGGDFLTMIRYRQPIIFTQFTPQKDVAEFERLAQSLGFKFDSASASLPPAARLRAFLAVAKPKIAELLDPTQAINVRSPDALIRKEACSTLVSALYNLRRSVAGYRSTSPTTLIMKLPIPPSDCKTKAESEALAAQAQTWLNGFDLYLKYSGVFAPEPVDENRIENFRTMDMATAATFAAPINESFFSSLMPPTGINFSGADLGEFWKRNINSSTNYNRRRAAYILSTYFCDDLTPIKVETPQEHAKGQHASDPACRACHYKLDPMAGFFRNRGAKGIDETQALTSTFDDGLELSGAERQTYLNSWANPPGAERPWNVGYIRSATQNTRNSYGDNIEDLFKIIETAPEVRRCLVRRMAEFFVNSKQSFDGEWMLHLQAKFDTAAAQNSTDAFKAVVKELVLSRAFAVHDPDPATCYDFVGDAPASKLPCAVRFIVSKNCTACHSGDGAGGLDLTNWIKLPNGGEGFTHLDENGHQLNARTTFQRIVDRLQATDPAVRMPRGVMDDGDRAKLFTWASGILERTP